MPAWNPKCVSSEALRIWGAGQKFKITFEMNGKRKDAYGTIVEYTENRLIHFRYTYNEPDKTGTVDEIFELFPKGEKTKITHTVDLSGAGFPPWAKILISMISRFGRKVGTGSLDEIASLIK